MLKPTDNFDPATVSASSRRRSTSQSRGFGSERNHDSGFQPLTPPSTPKVKELTASPKALKAQGRISEQEKSVIRGEIEAQLSEPLVSRAVACESGPSEGPVGLKNKKVSEKLKTYASNLEQQEIQQQKEADCENKDCGCFVVCPSHSVPVDCTYECPPTLAKPIHFVGKFAQDTCQDCVKTFGINFAVKTATEHGYLPRSVAEIMGMTVNPPQQQQMSRGKNVETAQAPVLSQNPGGQTRSPTEMRSTTSAPHPPMASMSASILPIQNRKQGLSFKLEPQCIAFTAESQMESSSISSQNQPSVVTAIPSGSSPNQKPSISSLVGGSVLLFLIIGTVSQFTKFSWNFVFGRTCFQQSNSQNKISSLKNQEKNSLDVRELLIQNTSETKELQKTVELLVSGIVELSERVEKIEKSLNQKNEET